MEFSFKCESMRDIAMAHTALGAILQAGSVPIPDQVKIPEKMAEAVGALKGESVVQHAGPVLQFSPGTGMSNKALTVTETLVENGLTPKASGAALENTLEEQTAGADDSPDAPGEYTKDQIKQAATSNPELAALVSKKGKKSATEKARMQELTRHVLGAKTCAEAATAPAKEQPPVGQALAGMTAEQLNQAIKSVGTTVAGEGDTQVQVLGDAKTAAHVAQEALLGKTHTARLAAPVSTNTAVDLDFLGPKTEAPVAMPTPPLNTPAPADAGDGLESLSRDDLVKKVQAHGFGELGFAWLRNVVEAGGGSFDKLKADYMVHALRNPGQFK